MHFTWVKKAGLYFVLASIANISPCTAMELLIRLTKLFKDYCGVLTEESIRANFTLLYEVVDEIIDWGYAQSTTDSIKALIFNEPVQTVKVEQPTIKKLQDLVGSKTTAANAVDVPISFKGDKDRKNEVFLDILERLNMTFGSNGVVLNQGIDGTIQMKSYLAGKPQLKIALSDNVVIGKGSTNPHGVIELDNVNFHECVNRQEFEESKVLTFVPPDGEFVLLNYQITSEFPAPFRIFPFFEMTSAHKCDLVIKVRAEFAPANHGSHVTVQIPMPKATASVTMTVAQGQMAEFEEKDRTVRWRIKKMVGGTEETLRLGIVMATAQTAAVRKDIGPISMQFEVPMFSLSQLHVKYLRVVDTKGLNPHRWVRYITRANSYVCRM